MSSMYISRRPRSSRRVRPSPPRRLRIIRVGTRLALVGLSLFATLVLGLATQLYDGPHAVWVARELSGAFYALAWCLSFALLRPTARPRTLALIALTICFGIEVLQLWHPHWLEVTRATLLGRLALGGGFAWLDLPYYALGAALGGLWLALLPFGQPALRDHERPFGAASRSTLPA